MEASFQERIYMYPEVHFGKPCVRDTRIPVYAVLELVREGISFDEIISTYYPDLTKQDISACIDYAATLVRDEEIHLAKS